MIASNSIANLATANSFTTQTSQKEKATPAPHDRCGWFQPSALRRANATAVNASAWRLVLLGAPGVGKGTQADLLNRRLETCHLSTGDLFRAASKQKDVEPSPAMRVALEYMRRGDLVPDSTVWEMVRERTECLRCSAGFVLDGFPRTLCQAESLKQLMESERIPLNAVVNYELPLADIVARLSGRRTCEKCKTVYHVTGNPPKVDGMCDRCQGNLFQREDDRPESITVRMATYERSTAPLIEFYKGLGLLVSVAAVGSPDEICARTIQALGARVKNESAGARPAF
jgi:adenylate kinase